MILRPVNSGDASRSPRPSAELTSALELLRSLLGTPSQKQLLDLDERPTNKMVYTHGLTLWI